MIAAEFIDNSVDFDVDAVAGGITDLRVFWLVLHLKTKAEHAVILKREKRSGVMRLSMSKMADIERENDECQR